MTIVRPLTMAQAAEALGISYRSMIDVVASYAQAFTMMKEAMGLSGRVAFSIRIRSLRFGEMGGPQDRLARRHRLRAGNHCGNWARTREPWHS